MMKNRKFQIALIIFSLTGQIAWVVENMYFNVFIYKMFRASASDIALMVTASAIAATLTTILMGALSDRIGKRKIFMCAGYIAWGISIISFALIRTDVISSLFGMVTGAATVGITLTIIMDCVMTFFGSTANDAAYNAWLTDSTDATNRGAAEGINSMMPLISILVVFAGILCFFFEGISTGKWLGDLLALLSGIFYAGVFMLNSFEKGDALSSVLFGQLACGIFLSPLVLKETDFSAPVLLYVFLLGAVQVGLAYIFFTTGTRYTDPVTASIINAMEPILNPILVAVFYGEMLGKMSMAGAGIVICGILYYNLKKIYSQRIT